MDLMKSVTALLSSLVIAGCTGNPVQVQSGPRSEQLIVRDFVNVLLQLDQLGVESTTLHIPFASTPDDPFAAALVEQLADAGYAIRTLTGVDPVEQAVTYDLSRTTDSQDGQVDTYTVSVGPISMRRSYAGVDQQRVRPVAPMQLTGVDSSGLRFNDELFQGTSPDVPITDQWLARDKTHESYVVLEASQASDDVQPESSNEAAVDLAVSPQADQDLMVIATPSTASPVSDTQAANDDLSEASRAPRKNVRELGQSNFASLFDSFGLVRESILTFDNDSIRLDGVNKARIKSFVEQFNPETDVFSVIGCSNGATSIVRGQKDLAIGRADVVKQELLFAGVSAEKILEEGCWAVEPYDERMPRRGVVLSLKRRLG